MDPTNASSEPPIHSMSEADRAVARDILTNAWTRLAATQEDAASAERQSLKPFAEAATPSAAGESSVAERESLVPNVSTAEGSGGVILDAITAAATLLPEFRIDVSADYARFAADAAVWYLDRAIRRIADPDRDGWTAERRAHNLTWFASTASAADLESLFAMAVALDTDDA
ncbi:MAG TPA: hypothetical protein VGQ62_21380 [Chloroflexota bacterium]|jgi:hypothetical protein|nr:hypothetical protein [Chloroflexota bacterium]